MQITAFHHLCKIANIRDSGYFALEVDEVTDSANKGQVIVCLRWVDYELQPHEEFIGLHYVHDITTATIVHVVKDTVLRQNLNMSMCRAQLRWCFQYASKEIKALEPRALYLHCFGHSLNLAVSDILKEVKITQDALDHAIEICKLLKFSPRRDALFQKLKNELSPQAPGLRNLCPTRWNVHALSLESIRLK